MARSWILAAAAFLSLASAQWAAAAPKDGPKRGRSDLDDVTQALSTLGPVVEAMMQAADDRRGDAPRLLSEALRTGKADGEAIAAIVSWVLKEKEETVARGFSDALTSVETTGRGPEGAQWDATSRAMVALFTTVLRDAETLHRRDAASLQREISAVVDAAAPAVAAALRESDPAGREMVIRGLQALASAAPDAGVREGAAQALKQIQGE